MKVNFIRKAEHEELIPQDEFVIEKEIVLDESALKSSLIIHLDIMTLLKIILT